jgi:hypothetical protein
MAHYLRKHPSYNFTNSIDVCGISWSIKVIYNKPEPLVYGSILEVNDVSEGSFSPVSRYKPNIPQVSGLNLVIGSELKIT